MSENLRVNPLIRIRIMGNMMREKVAILSRSDIKNLIRTKARNF